MHPSEYAFVVWFLHHRLKVLTIQQMEHKSRRHSSALQMGWTVEGAV
jgi:hypothetical protein